MKAMADLCHTVVAWLLGTDKAAPWKERLSTFQSGLSISGDELSSFEDGLSTFQAKVKTFWDGARTLEDGANAYMQLAGSSEHGERSSLMTSAPRFHIFHYGDDRTDTSQTRSNSTGSMPQ